MLRPFLQDTPRSGSRVATAQQSAVPRRSFSPLDDQEEQRIRALLPQEQAEELLERSIRHDERALDLFEEMEEDWAAKLSMTPRMTSLEWRSRFSRDLRVRRANAEINLAIQGWKKDGTSVDRLISRAEEDPDQRAGSLYYLGMLGGIGVESDQVHEVLANYARSDPEADVRQWAVEGLRFLGSDEALEELFYSFTHDASMEVRDRAGCNVSDCGIFTRQQRMRMVPKLIGLAEDAETTGQMKSWTFLALHEITDEDLPQNASAWRRWYDEHGLEKSAQFAALPSWQVNGDE